MYVRVVAYDTSSIDGALDRAGERAERLPEIQQEIRSSSRGEGLACEHALSCRTCRNGARRRISGRPRLPQ